MGWSSVNVIVGAQLLNAVNSSVPGWAGIIIIAAATFFVTLFGYKVVHAYEYWSWIPCFIVFLIVLGEFAHSGQFSNLPMNVGGSEAGSILSFAASVFGFGTGWTSYAADYTVYQPANSSRRKVFAWTFAGLIFPLCFTEMLGLAIATATIANPDYQNGYTDAGIGGLLGAVLLPPLGRFGQFCLVVLALSIIANNCPNIYSVTFSLQVMGRWTQAVPRFIWTFVGTVVYCAIAIPGYNDFAEVLEDFMLLIVSTGRISSASPPTNFPLLGLLARHLRRRRSHRALCLQKGLPRLRRLHLQLGLQAPRRHRRRHRFLLRYLWRRHGYEPALVHWPHWRPHWRSGVRRRHRVRACVCFYGS